MPRRFEHSATYPASPRKVHAALTDRAYWQARVAAVGGRGATIEAIVAQAGGVQVTLTQVVAAEHLPPVVSSLVNGDLKIARTENWGPLVSEAATADGTAAVNGTPATAQLTSLLSGDDESSTVRTTGQARVPIPLMGGRIEQSIADNIAQLLVAEQRFTAEWLAR